MSYTLEVVFTLTNVSVVDFAKYQISENVRIERDVPSNTVGEDGEPIKKSAICITFQIPESDHTRKNPLDPDPYYKKAKDQLSQLKEVFGLMGHPINEDDGYVRFKGGLPPPWSLSATISLQATKIRESDLPLFEDLFTTICDPKNKSQQRLKRIGDFVQRGYKFNIFESDYEYAFYNLWRACEIGARQILGKKVRLKNWQNPGELGLCIEDLSQERMKIFENTVENLTSLQPRSFKKYGKRVEEFNQNKSLGSVLALCYGLRGEIFHYGNTSEGILSSLYPINKFLSDVVIRKFIELMRKNF